jgi:Polyketide cyclase / dehydrase and lipid transport/Domain of unknown function (DUF4331)
VKIVGIGDAAAFKADGPEIRFTFQFEILKPGRNDKLQRQTGTCKLPDGQTLPIVVGDEQGVSTQDGVFRVFAGLRSDPFYSGWTLEGEAKPIPNIILEDNVLSLVVEFDTSSVLSPTDGSLFGAIAETAPRNPNQPPSAGNPGIPRFDWVGRPEQTNVRLVGANGAVDIRDLWNQETPFAISESLSPLFRKRMAEAIQIWDMRDGKIDWEPSALAAHVNVFLEDYLVFDVAKPITDTSHLEIEKSTIDGRAYTTGGGRTLDANCIDILLTWLANHDRGPFWQGGAAGATQPGGTTFPYAAPPNNSLLTVARSANLAATPQAVWAVVGQFGDGSWHPLIANVQTIGTGVGQLRRITTIDGKTIVERLEDIDDARMTLKYGLVSGIPAIHYQGTMDIKPHGSGSTISWSVRYRPDGQAKLIVELIVSTLLSTGLAALTKRFGSAH